MFSKALSLVLIAAVIACPMRCGNGLCHAGHCCAADGDNLGDQASTVCGVHEGSNCCCENPLPVDDHGPSRCPDKALCQGVCGGAVFEKPCELAGPETTFFLPVILGDGSLGSLLAQLGKIGIDHHHCVHAKSHGRFLRTLHSSFLI